MWVNADSEGCGMKRVGSEYEVIVITWAAYLLIPHVLYIYTRLMWQKSFKSTVLINIKISIKKVFSELLSQIWSHPSFAWTLSIVFYQSRTNVFMGLAGLSDTSPAPPSSMSAPATLSTPRSLSHALVFCSLWLNTFFLLAVYVLSSHGVVGVGK